MIVPVLLFGYGNPSRGDDALGPALLERIEALRPRHPQWPELECLTDFQLQVEHVLDLQGRERVLFVDADTAARPPFSFSRISPARMTGYTTHVLTPPELLETFARVLGAPPPAAFLLGIRGERFALGESMSRAATANLGRAVAFAADWLRDPNRLR
jgi:hydrogenase maturation protease